ncbi:uncharacterized protein LAESUDRAFT_758832 [Laetiporus sulphureus 93-53]|uniref:BAG domain-containing protein n=1 Tax=Laetiporus sulphureus 93-53 TaxID=1314785 RepID=A0A165EGM3_9APHY|nr:uncharacterized protein LAESUDRAFT_758832 [Laetiporus sulphureus 93-53]KZT07014.1 hypothetical protein LAESUDRAFT_758832 [Laetiporus sulphureus 93-53]
MFGHNPYGAYSPPYPSGNSYGARPSYHDADAEYLRALADERAAREQLIAARRAQEEARQRAAAAHARQSRAPYFSPRPTYVEPGYDIDYEDHDAYDGGLGALNGLYDYGGISPYPELRGRRAMMGEQRRQTLERERERQREREREEQRMREEVEREQERRKLEEERKALEQERRRLEQEEQLRQLLRQREEDEWSRRRKAPQRPTQGAFDAYPFLRTIWPGMDLGEEEEEEAPRTGRPTFRAQTVSPKQRQVPPSQPTRAPVYPNVGVNVSGVRSSSVPSRHIYGQPSSLESPTSQPSPPPPASAKHGRVPVPMPSPRAQAKSPGSPYAPSPKPAESPKPTQPKPEPQPTYTPEEEAAVSMIQNLYRRYNALKTIGEERARFEKVRAGFSFPSHLDFVVAPPEKKEGETTASAVTPTPTTSLAQAPHVSVPVDSTAVSAARASCTKEGMGEEEQEEKKPARPELAYTPDNAPVHGYLEALSRVLSALDAVESRGDREVRETRKLLAREVEREAEGVEKGVRTVWEAYAQRERERAKASDDPAGSEPERSGISASENAELTEEHAAEVEPVDAVDGRAGPCIVPADMDAGGERMGVEEDGERLPRMRERVLEPEGDVGVPMIRVEDINGEPLFMEGEQMEAQPEMGEEEEDVGVEGGGEPVVEVRGVGEEEGQKRMQVEPQPELEETMATDGATATVVILPSEQEPQIGQVFVEVVEAVPTAEVDILEGEEPKRARQAIVETQEEEVVQVTPLEPIIEAPSESASAAGSESSEEVDIVLSIGVSEPEVQAVAEVEEQQKAAEGEQQKISEESSSEPSPYLRPLPPSPPSALPNLESPREPTPTPVGGPPKRRVPSIGEVVERAVDEERAEGEVDTPTLSPAQHHDAESSSDGEGEGEGPGTPPPPEIVAFAMDVVVPVGVHDGSDERGMERERVRKEGEGAFGLGHREWGEVEQFDLL